MAKKGTPHLDNWLRTFRGVGKELGKAGVATLEGMAPGVSGTVTSTADVLRDSRAFITKTRNQVAYQSRALMRNTTGRKASNIITGAFTDIKNGTFAINKSADSAYDMMDDFDSSIDKINVEISSASDPGEAALAESKKNTALLGKVVAQGNAATIEGLEHMTNTMATVNMKIADANTMKMTNISLMGINQMNAGIAGINGRLDTINQNILSIMDFHRSNTSVMNQQMMEYNSQSLQMMNEIGSGMAEIRDYMKAQREYMEMKQEITKPESMKERFDFSSGFDAHTYKDMIKRNWERSDIGMYTNMGKMMFDMAGMAGQSPLTVVLSTLMQNVLPKSLTKSVGRFDKSFSSSINNLLYRIGDLDDSDNFLLKSIGQIFGLKKETFNGPKMNTFKRDAMSWNGLAQQTLVEVIPNYLARIESKLTGNEARFYNMETGTFQGESSVRSRYQQKFSDTVNLNMSDFRSKFKGAVKDDKYREEMASMVNDMIYNEILSGNGSKGKTRQELIRGIDSVLRSGSQQLDEKTIHDLLMEATSGLDKTLEDLSDTLKQLNSAERNLFNDETRGHSTNEYRQGIYNRGNIFKKRYFGSNGKSWEAMTEKERREEAKSARYKDFLKHEDEWDDVLFQDSGVFEDIFGVDPNKIGGGIRKRMDERAKKYSRFVDRAADTFYDYASGIRKHGGNRPRSTSSVAGSNNTVIVVSPSGDATIDNRMQAASSRDSMERGSRSGRARGVVNQAQQRITSTINKAAERMTGSGKGLDGIIDQSQVQMNTNAKNTSKLVHNALANNKGNEAAIIDNPTTALTERMTDNENSLKSMVLSLNDNFLSPMVGGIFGKNGFINRIFSEDNMKKVRDMLFDEENGPFGGVTVWFKEKMGEISHAFTGKGYEKRDGTWVGEKTDSVLDYISNGYDFIYSNTMKYLFGDEYKENETFQKYFQWADWKTKRQEKRDARIKKHEEDEKRKKAQSNVTHNTMNIINGPAGMSPEDQYVQSMQYVLPMNGSMPLALPDKSSQSNANIDTGFRYEDIIDVDGAVIESKVIEEEKSTALAVIREATENTAEKITSTGTALSTMVLGKEATNERKVESEQSKTNKSFLDKIKKFLPAGAAGAIGGALVGTSVGIHGAGLIGSLFLPGGPISGAILGVGLSMLAKSDKFQKFMFGEKDADGKRTGGMISQKTQDAFKKSLPLVVGASAIGAIKGIFKSAVGLGVAGGPGGFLLNTLLPGGPIGGAMLGLGIALLKNNEGFQKILWGEKNEDGKRTGGILSKASSSVSKFMQKSGHFAKGGLKGALIGAGTGLALGQMGLIGSALAVGGPIGMGLAGLGIGIASQTQRFQDLLFGTKEFDEKGNFKGRRGDGLLLKVRNMLVVNVLDPVKETLQYNVDKFAYWLKDNVTYPFRLAFGPILDSMSMIKKDVHETFENLAEKLGEHIKKGVESVFSPVTKVMGFVGKSIAAVTRHSVQLAMAPVSIPLKMLQFATSGMRRRAKGEERATLFGNIGTIARGVFDQTKQDWENDDREYGDGIGGRINRFMTHGVDFIKNAKGGYNAAKDAYRAEMSEQGLNHLNWRGVPDERKQDKRNKKLLARDRKAWNNIDKVRKELISENKYGEAYYSEEGLDAVRERLVKADKRFAGLITSNKDLNELLYNKSDFKDKLAGKEKKDKRSVEEILKDGIKTEPGKEQDKYQQGVLSRFDFITQEFTKFAARDAIAKKKNIDVEDLSSMNERLKKAGLTWKDVGVDPSRLVKMNSISNEDWDKYMKDKFGDGAQMKDDPTGFKDLIRDILEGVNSIKKSSEENLNINESDLAAENGSSRDDLKKARRGNTTSIASKNKKKSDKAIRDAIEKDESEKAQKGHINPIDKEDNDEALIDGMQKDKDAKKTVFDSVGGFVKGLFGTLGGFILSPTLWKVLGIGTLVMGLFGDKIMAFGKKFFEFIKPYGEAALTKIGSFISEKLPAFLTTASDFIQEHAPAFVEKLTAGIVDNMGPIIDAAWSVTVAALKTIGKKAANYIAGLINPNWTPFDDVANNDTKTYDTEEEAKVAAEEQGLNAYGNQILDKNTIVVHEQVQVVDENGNPMYDENGNPLYEEQESLSKVKAGHSAFIRSAGREAMQFARSPINRSLMKKTVKVGGKAAAISVGALAGGPLGAVLGMLPGGKIIRGSAKLVKGGINAGKGIVGGFNKAGSFIKSKFGKTAVTETGEAIIKEGAEEALKSGDIVKQMAKNGKYQYYQMIENEAGQLIKSPQMKKEAAEAAIKEGANVVETVSKNAAKSVGEAEIEGIAKKGAKKALGNVAEEAGEVAAKKGIIKKFLEKCTGLLKGAAETVKKFIGETKFVKWAVKFVDDIGKKIISAKIPVISKVVERITVKSAEAAGRTAADATVIIGIGFAIYDAVNGAMDAPYLFGVDSKDTTAGMRAVSSIMYTLLGTAVGAWIDILLEVFHMVTGINAKQWMARSLYKALGGDAEKLQDSIDEMEAETQKYNKANGTNITSEEYNELKNSNKSIGGRVKQGAGWLKSKITFWDDSDDKAHEEKYDFSKYAVTEQEKKNYKATKDISKSSGSATINDQAIADYNGSDLVGNGPGPNTTSPRAIGYGGIVLQSDPRWANFQIGKFPNGETSTMATGGCGPTALSMVAQGMGTSSVDPLGVANYAKQKGYIQDGGATSDLFTSGAKDMGLTASKLDKSGVKSALANGESIILSGKSNMNGPYTEAGHVIAATGLDSSGNAIVNDPMRGTTHISTSELTSGMTHGWSYSNSVGYGNALLMPNTSKYYFEYKGNKYIPNVDVFGMQNGYKKIDATFNLTGYTKLLLPPQNFVPAPEDLLSFESLTSSKKSSNVTTSVLATNPTGIYGPIYSVNASAVPSLDDLMLNRTYANAINSGYMKASDLQIPRNSKSWMFDPWVPGSPRLQPEIQIVMKDGTLKTQQQFESKLKQGYVKSNGECKFNSKEVYSGLKVADLSALAIYEPSLLVDDNVKGFKRLYNYFVKSGRYKMNHALTNSEIEGILGRSDFVKSLGGNGKYDEYEYKYGFPFFQTDDARWANISWRGGTIASRGGDISSLASVATAFAPNIITPQWINDKWIKGDASIWMNGNEMNLDRVFSSEGAGFNSFTETRVDDKKLKVKKLLNTSSIISKLKQNIPVVLTGYRYKGSPFGGSYSLANAKTTGPDDYATVVARAANDTHMAVLDPFTTLSQKGIFDTDVINDKINGKSVIKSAYMVSDPEGKGIQGRVDLSKKEGGTSDYQSIKDAKGLDKISALFNNIVAIGSHLVESFVSGEEYRSIKSINEIENSGMDEAGLQAVETIKAEDEANSENNAIIDSNPNADYKRGAKDDKDPLKSDTTYWLVVKNTDVGKLMNQRNPKKAKKYGSLAKSDKEIVKSVSTTLTKGKKSTAKMDTDIGAYAPTRNKTYYYVNITTKGKNTVMRFDKVLKASVLKELTSSNIESSSSTNKSHSSSGGKTIGVLTNTPMSGPTFTQGTTGMTPVIGGYNNNGIVTNGSAITVGSSSSRSHSGGGGGRGFGIGYGLGGGHKDLVFGPSNFTLVQDNGTNNTTSSPNRKIDYIVEHYTAGVSSKTGSARAVAGWFRNPKAGGSADFIVDDTEFVQYNADPKNRYTHAVGGAIQGHATSLAAVLNGKAGNSNSVSIEITSSKKNTSSLNATDSDWYFTDAVLNNAATLTNYLMKEYNIPKDNVIMHHHVNGKLCPAMWTQDESKLSGWKNFQSKLTGTYNGTVDSLAGSSTSTDGGSENSTNGSATVTSSQSPEEIWASMDLTKKLNIIAAANEATAFGDDYEEAKNAAIMTYASGGSTSEDGSSDGSYSTGTLTDMNVTINENGREVAVPDGFPKSLSHMGWQMITSPSSYQYKLRSEAGMNFDSDGLGIIKTNGETRYTVAVKPAYGKTGDLINVNYKDGTILKAIVADQKGNENNKPGKPYYDVSKYVHSDGSVVEFVLDKTGGFAGYNGSKTVAKLHPEWMKEMKSITNIGNYWGNNNETWGGTMGYGIADLVKSGYLPNIYGIGRAIGYGSSWLDICALTKQAFSAARSGADKPYNQGVYFDIEVNGYKVHTRSDCSGFVSACISAYTKQQFLTDTSGLGSNCSILKNNGFTYISWPGRDGLQPGDILIRGGHTCIFAGQPNKVWNAGSSDSIRNPGTTTDSSSYTGVWRCGNAGSLSANINTTGMSTPGGSSMDGGSAQVSEANDPFSKLVNSMSASISGALPGLNGGTLSDPNIGFGKGRVGSPQDFFESTLGGKMTSGYGKRSSELGNEYHRGMDFAAPYGQDIFSPIDGHVVDAGTDVAGYGNYAVVRDGSGNNHIFAHMANPIGYGVGSKISKNDVIGQVGDSGNTTGSHLHYEIRKSGNKYSAINPTGFKYDSTLGKSLNVHSVNSKFNDNEEAIGTGRRDFASEVQDKLNVALNTTNIEDKMDSIIGVLGTMAEGISGMAKQPATSSITNNTTVYGPGKSSTTTVVRGGDNQKVKKDDSMTLAEYHKMIAGKK